MPYRQLYVWVEGGDDELFFNRVVRPLLASRYNLIEVVPFAQRPPGDTCDHLADTVSSVAIDLTRVGVSVGDQVLREQPIHRRRLLPFT